MEFLYFNDLCSVFLAYMRYACWDFAPVFFTMLEDITVGSLPHNIIHLRATVVVIIKRELNCLQHFSGIQIWTLTRPFPHPPLLLSKTSRCGFVGVFWIVILRSKLQLVDRWPHIIFKQTLMMQGSCLNQWLQAVCSPRQQSNSKS